MDNNDSNSDSPRLHEVAPRENSGRDTIARYQAQFRAAAYECLSILGGKSIDRVYCDFQDDFVSRRMISGSPEYHFFQVKTKSKRNHQWGMLDLFGVYKRKSKEESPKKIADSFGGKLLLHTIKFNGSCGSVIFLTNVHFDDDVEDIIDAIKFDSSDNKNYAKLVSGFNEAFEIDSSLSREEIIKHLRKLSLSPGVKHLDPNDETFSAIARDAIYKYSEVDLQHGECEEIIKKLVSLVERKSFSKLLSNISEYELDEVAGVGVADLLEILSISKGAYNQLLKGGDSSAIKNASIIQRKLLQAGASEKMIEYVSKCKVDWDVWLRDKRHTIPEFDLNFLLDDIARTSKEWAQGGMQMVDLNGSIDRLWNIVCDKNISSTLTRELILGGIFSAVVRSESL